MIGALVLLVGTIKLFVWINQRYILRQRAYEATRVQAGSAPPSTRTLWNEPTQTLDFFGQSQP